MVHGAHVNDDIRAGHGGPDAGDFGQSVRRLAQDAHRILRCPDSPIDELIELHSQVLGLLNDAAGSRSAGILGWLHAVRGRVGARLRSWSAGVLESPIA
jgi:hypothetical protein